MWRGQNKRSTACDCCAIENGALTRYAKRDPVDCCCVSNQNVTTLETNLFFLFSFLCFFLFLFKGNKMGHLGSAAHHAAAAAAAASSLQFFYQGGGDPHLGQPPPAHMGIPPYQLDPKTAGAMGKNHQYFSNI